MANIVTDFIFERVRIPDYKKFLDLTSFRHKLISSNVANASTPGYEARDIAFKEEFARLTEKSNHLEGMTTNSRHIPLGHDKRRPPEVQEARVTSGEINSVDIDKEMADLAQNELFFTVGARLLQRKFEGLRKAITSKG
jgi:flagellar basal-body rod protein FlgB